MGEGAFDIFQSLSDIAFGISMAQEETMLSLRYLQLC